MASDAFQIACVPAVLVPREFSSGPGSPDLFPHTAGTGRLVESLGPPHLPSEYRTPRRTSPEQPLREMFGNQFDECARRVPAFILRPYPGAASRARLDLWSYSASEFDQSAVIPIVTWGRCCTCERPQADACGIDPE